MYMLYSNMICFWNTKGQFTAGFTMKSFIFIFSKVQNVMTRNYSNYYFCQIIMFFFCFLFRLRGMAQI